MFPIDMTEIHPGERGHKKSGVVAPSLKIHHVQGGFIFCPIYNHRGVAKDIGLPYLHIFGDSSMIITWAKKESTLDMVNLKAWCYNTIFLMSSFT